MFSQIGAKPAAASGAGGDSQRAKRVALSSTTEAKADAALKLSVINSQRNRLLEAACTYQFVLKTDDALYVSMKNAHDQEYLPRVKGQKGHNLGAPDSFQFAAAVLCLASKGSQEQQAILRKYADNHAPGSLSAQLIVKLFRTEKMHDSKCRRLILALADKELELAVVDLLHTHMGANVFTGPRPAGYLEVEGQKMLNPS